MALTIKEHAKLLRLLEEEKAASLFTLEHCTTVLSTAKLKPDELRRFNRAVKRCTKKVFYIDQLLKLL